MILVLKILILVLKMYKVIVLLELYLFCSRYCKMFGFSRLSVKSVLNVDIVRLNAKSLRLAVSIFIGKMI